MAIQRRVSRKRNQGLVGTESPVILEGPSRETELLWEARLSTQAPEIDGICYINDLGEGVARAGQIRRMRITEAHDYDLIGELTDEAPLNSPPPPAGLLQILPARPAARYEVSDLS
jgi:ribosomal protein S12 methylthiotransferase